MMKAGAVLLLALSIGTVSAHVKLFFSDSTTDLGSRPIRNANAEEADGTFSVSGPCGGTQAWGANGFSEVQNGGSVTVKINYNGGHKSPSNEFTARFACGNPSQEDIRDTTDLAAASCTTSAGCAGDYPCPAPTGNSVAEGYIFECTLPTQSAGDECTFSVLDQRDWGGCVDLKLTAQPPPEDDDEEKDSSGFYAVQADPSATQDCCFEEGRFVVDHDVGAGTMSVVMQDMVAVCGDTKVPQDDRAITMAKDAGSATFRGSLTLSSTTEDQDYQLSVSDGNVLLQNVDEDTPLLCDPLIKSASAFDTSGGSGTNNKAGVSAGVTLSLAAALGAIAFISWDRRRQKPLIGGVVNRCMLASQRKVGMVGTIFGGLLALTFVCCLGTENWVYADGGCSLGLTTYSCDNDSGSLEGDLKDVGNAMAGLGSLAFIGLFVLTVISLMLWLNLGPAKTNADLMANIGLGLFVLTWVFLTAGWGHYASEDAGIPSWNEINAEWGPSFAFTVIVWLAMFAYGGVWIITRHVTGRPPVDNAMKPSAPPSANATWQRPSVVPPPQDPTV